jgi:predicted RNase H-like nuclease (RuvC/YqgF family)
MGGRSKRSKSELDKSSSGAEDGPDTKSILIMIQSSLELLNKRFDKQEQIVEKLEVSLGELSSRLEQQQQKISELSEANTKLQQESDTIQQNQHYFNTEIDFLKGEVNDLQQQRLNKDIIISNLPIVDNLDTKTVFEKILQLFKIDQSVICKQYNVINTSRNYHHINVTFTTEEAKIAFLDKKKELGVLLWQQLLPENLLTDSNKIYEIYVSEKLTQFNLELLREARKVQKSGLVKFAWHQGGAVLVRKIIGGPIIKIRQFAQLNRITSSSQQQQQQQQQ